MMLKKPLTKNVGSDTIPGMSEMIQRPERGEKNYQHNLENYCNTLEGYVRLLHRAVRYAHNHIETDIPSLDQVISDTKVTGEI